jgi:hypothetical protein
MSEDLVVPDLPPKRVRHHGTCELCTTECIRDPGGTWYNFFGRDQCKFDPDEGPHIVREYAEQEAEPRLVPAMAVAHLTYRDKDGQVRVDEKYVPEGAVLEVTFSEPLTVISLRIEAKPPKLVS